MSSDTPPYANAYSRSAWDIHNHVAHRKELRTSERLREEVGHIISRTHKGNCDTVGLHSLEDKGSSLGQGPKASVGYRNIAQPLGKSIYFLCSYESSLRVDSSFASLIRSFAHCL